MRKFLERLRAGLRFRRQALLQFVMVVRSDFRNLSDVRGLIWDYVWRAVIRGHLTDGLLHEAFMELEDASGFTPGKIANGQEWYLLAWCDEIFERMLHGGEAVGYLPGFIASARAHFDGCERCQRRAVVLFQETARTIQLVRLATQDDPLDEAAHQRIIDGVMARIQAMEAGPSLRIVGSGDEGEK